MLGEEPGKIFEPAELCWQPSKAGTDLSNANKINKEKNLRTVCAGVVSKCKKVYYQKTQGRVQTPRK